MFLLLKNSADFTSSYSYSLGDHNGDLKSPFKLYIFCLLLSG